MVDVAWYPLLHRSAIVERYTGYDFLAAFPKLKKWQTELMKVKALSRSVADEFEAFFIEFYLNEQTYLGQLMRYKAA